MIIAGTSFLIGSVFQASANAHVSLLFIGRIFWGVGELPPQSHYALWWIVPYLVVDQSARCALYPCICHMMTPELNFKLACFKVQLTVVY